MASGTGRVTSSRYQQLLRPGNRKGSMLLQQAKDPGAKRKKVGEVWIKESLYPSGISNPANNCWANAVLQCLLNNSVSMQVIKELAKNHPGPCAVHCNRFSKPLKINVKL